MRVGESESDVILRVAPISDVPKIEHYRFIAYQSVENRQCPIFGGGIVYFRL